MAVDLKTLKKHPGRNPDYIAFATAEEKGVFRNRHKPKFPSKYLPHIGAKQRAKAAAGKYHGISRVLPVATDK